MREPVRPLDRVVARAVESVKPEQHPALPRFTPRKLVEPDQRFIAELKTCIQGTGRVETSALYLGLTRTQWRRWRQRAGEPYDSLRRAIAEALLHAEMDWRLKLSRKNPGAALKELRRTRTRDAEPEPETRAYHAHGLHSLKKALPALLDRVNDAAIPDDDLSPVEHAARALRSEMLSDLGGAQHVSAAQRVLVDNIVGSWIIAQSLDRFVFELAQREGLASRKHRRAWPVIEQRMKVASVLASQLTALGLQKREPPPQDPHAYMYGDTPEPESKET